MMKARIIRRTEGVIMNSINSMCASSIFKMWVFSALMTSIIRVAYAPDASGSYRRPGVECGVVEARLTGWRGGCCSVVFDMVSSYMTLNRPWVAMAENYVPERSLTS